MLCCLSFTFLFFFCLDNEDKYSLYHSHFLLFLLFTDNEEEQRAGQLAVAASRSGNNDGSGHCRGQKIRILAAVFSLALSSLILLSRHEETSHEKREER